MTTEYNTIPPPVYICKECDREYWIYSSAYSHTYDTGHVVLDPVTGGPVNSITLRLRNRAAQRAADSFAEDLLTRTVHLGPDRADVLTAIASILSTHADELRARGQRPGA